MTTSNTPGITRDNRISNEGLLRLKAQLQMGIKISQPVLQQWINRYGEPARKLIHDFGYDNLS